ncbi:hypothetical protein AB0136_26665, partial [Klebsiella pneumoniae]
MFIRHGAVPLIGFAPLNLLIIKIPATIYQEDVKTVRNRYAVACSTIRIRKPPPEGRLASMV